MISTNNKHRVRALSETRRAETGFWNAAVPSVCVVPLQQHHGSRVTPAVAVGDVVREGSVIGTGRGRFSTLVHAPIPGTVSQIGEMQMPDGKTSLAVSIELSGEFDQLGKVPASHPWEGRDREELLGLIESGGVVCTGRSLLPLHAVLRRKHVTNPVRIVVDLAQTEPYGHAELEAAISSSSRVVEALAILREVLEADSVVVAVHRGRRKQTRAFRDLAEEHGIRSVFLAPTYPANLDYQICQAAFGLRIARHGLALDEGVHIISPTTALAVFEAVVFQKPQIDRIVTVAGEAVARPASVRARIGTSVSDLIEECGGLVSTPARIVMGGSLTGREVTNINAPITKGTASVLALSASEVQKAPTLPCVGCGACLRSCPVSLDPIFLVRLIQARATKQAELAGLDSCVECGLCSHVCPSRVPLAEQIRMSRSSRRSR